MLRHNLVGETLFLLANSLFHDLVVRFDHVWCEAAAVNTIILVQDLHIVHVRELSE